MKALTEVELPTHWSLGLYQRLNEDFGRYCQHDSFLQGNYLHLAPHNNIKRRVREPRLMEKIRTWDNYSKELDMKQ